MSYPESARPPGCTLPCWSWKYQDGDPECAQCPYRESCRSAVLWRSSQAPPAPQSVMQMPQRQYAAPVPPPQPIYRQPPVQPQQQVVQYQPPQQAAVPYTNTTPNPLAPWQRPGAPSPPYYFNQYPGETIGSRLGKNMVLRALESVFTELMYFFRHWTWPPRS